MKLNLLLKIKDGPINDLNPEELKELQTALDYLGYPVRDIDGLIGPRTRNAWAEFKEDIYQSHPESIGQGSVKALQERLADEKEHNFKTKDGTVAAIIYECKRQGLALPTQISYVLATTELETNNTFQPVKEAYWLSEEWRRNNLRYFPWYGRGYVQLTWKSNYQKYGRIFGFDLAANADRAMEHNLALFILVHGFKTGTFTGRKITDYINSDRTDFVNARRCINGTDRAHDIAQLAKKWRTNI